MVRERNKRIDKAYHSSSRESYVEDKKVVRKKRIKNSPEICENAEETSLEKQLEKLKISNMQRNKI
jgi:hypothetical protein